jgi:hypothetical protein
MPKWSKAVLRTIGVLDAALSLCGFYFIFMSVWGGAFALSSNADTPYFRIAFAAMTAINFGFLILFLLSGFQLLRLKRSGVIMHATTSVALIGYDLSVGIFWLSRSRVGISVGAATGVGNMGTAPFQFFNFAPYVYPIVSSTLLFLAGWKATATLQSSSEIAR